MNIAIIGAGLTGLLAANALRAKGANVTIFEKSRGTGGRLATKRWDWGHVDIGAQYFTARSDGFRALVNEWVQCGVAQQWLFLPHAIIAGRLTPSPDAIARFVGTPDMNSIAHHLARDLKILFTTRIAHVTQCTQQWQLQDEQGTVFKGFDRLISTLPREQAEELLADYRQKPDALEHQNRVDPMPIHRPCWALALATKGQVAAEVEGIFGDQVFSWVARQTHKPLRQRSSDYDDIWLLHSAPQWTQRHGKDCAPQLQQMGIQWLQDVLGTQLEVVHAAQHYWRYANLAAGAEANPLSHTADAPAITTQPSAMSALSMGAVYGDDTLVVSGAWAWGGKVEGAFHAAQAIAQTIP